MGTFTQEHTKMIEDTQGHTGNTHRTNSQGLMRTPSQRLTGPHTGTHRDRGSCSRGHTHRDVLTGAHRAHSQGVMETHPQGLTHRTLTGTYKGL